MSQITNEITFWAYAMALTAFVFGFMVAHNLHVWGILG